MNLNLDSAYDVGNATAIQTPVENKETSKLLDKPDHNPEVALNKAYCKGSKVGFGGII